MNRSEFRQSVISTHALTEGDFGTKIHDANYTISTHALTEGDDHRSFRTPGRSHFNSRPHGGRPSLSTKSIRNVIFQLTPSRRATLSDPDLSAQKHISTHALTEGDLFRSSTSCSRGYFNSRPHGGRPRSNHGIY